MRLPSSKVPGRLGGKGVLALHVSAPVPLPTPKDANLPNLRVYGSPPVKAALGLRDVKLLVPHFISGCVLLAAKVVFVAE